ncbi:MAG: class I SAM-dependent DNA methyltransferase [Bacteroidales bacterium]|nr:class I SAM-dependent DNA methyltransferase [Bacteroidales bacterium]
MTPQQQQTAAAEFAAFWADKGDEKQETQRFWIQLLSEVLGIENPTKYIEFEKRVKLSHTSFIDAYLPDTKTLIEQKGAKIDLHRAYEQSDGSTLTPYQQAKRYADEMPNSLRPRWIVVCNFQEFLVYDLEKPGAEPEQIFLKNLEKEYYRLQFLADAKHDYLRREEELSLQAGVLVGKLYDALIKQYINPDESSLRSLNILCVRLVFCLYAEDAGLFSTRTAFEDYLRTFAVENLRDGIIKLFKALDTPETQRDKYDEKLKPFPYVNGGLFRDEQIEIPHFTPEILDVICNHCAPFNWSDISPTIFGAVFESTLNQKTRREGGMHYTSVANIHKVIDPLFMDELNAEYQTIVETRRASTLRQQLIDFQQKLGSLKILDPACGSGNFLTETYLSLRRLENKVISTLNKGEKVIGFEDFIHVKISQFYGIEINDFAVTVAKTALWIAESQMMEETEKILGMNLNFLPLKTNAYIVEGNALRTDWATLQPIDADSAPTEGLFSGFTTQTDGERHEYDYIIGNPPFVGGKMMSSAQKEDMISVFGKKWKNIGNMDYVCCWYKKAIELLQGNKTQAALVSTNSVCQGQAVAALWKPLYENYGVQIDFAWRTFRWDSESNQKAHVHCVIVGFSCANEETLRATSLQSRRIFNADGTIINAHNINPYLIDAKNVFIDNRTEPICDVPEMTFGSMPNDGGNFILLENEKNEILSKEPNLEKFIRVFLGSQEFINKKIRFCLWLKHATPNEIKNSPELYRRVTNVRKLRSESTAAPTREKADIPHLFFFDSQPENGDYLLVPGVSSEKREYIPMGFLHCNVVASNLVYIVPNANLYHFGVLTSSVHMAWMRAVCGRLEMRYRYSNAVVYNNFPWCNPTDEQKARIEKTAQAILDARSLFPESSLADLYDEVAMPPELRRAHRENDKAVMAAYGFEASLSEQEIVARLFEMYEKLRIGTK